MVNGVSRGRSPFETWVRTTAEQRGWRPIRTLPAGDFFALAGKLSGAEREPKARERAVKEGKCLALAMCVHLYPSVFSRRKPWVHPTCPFRLPLRCQKRIIEKEERSGGSAAFRRHKRASSRCLWRGSYGTMLRSPSTLCAPFLFLLPLLSS